MLVAVAVVLPPVVLVGLVLLAVVLVALQTDFLDLEKQVVVVVDVLLELLVQVALA